MILRRLSRGIFIGLILALCSPASGAVKQVASVLVVAPSGTQIRHVGTGTFLAVDTGAEFLPGDAIRAGGESPLLLGCTGSGDAARNLTYELAPNSEVVFASGVPPEARNVQKMETPCTLPLDDRLLPATMDDSRVRANLKGSWRDRVNLLSEQGRQELEKRLQPVEATLATKPDDLLSLLALARTLENAGLIADAIEAYLRLYQAHKPAAWAPRSSTRLLARLAPEPDINVVIPPRPEERNPDLHARRVGGDKPPSTDTGTGPIAPRGEVYALLVGLDKYPNTVGVRNLDYAGADAKLFREFLESPRGGRVMHITPIDSSNGTESAIRRGLEDLVAGHAGSDNTLIIYIAAHGYYGCVDDHGVPVNTGCDARHAEPFILTTDTSSDGPRATGLPMSTLESLIGENAYRFGRVLVYIDVCHAHVLPWSRGRAEPPPVPPDAIKVNFEAQEGAIGLMLASSQDPNHQRELAYESDQLHHGIFTYFVVEGLGGATMPAGNVVLFSDLYDHVKQRVKSFTDGQQVPSLGDLTSQRIAAVNDAHTEPFPVPPPDPGKGKITPRSRSPRRDPLASPLPPAIPSAGTGAASPSAGGVDQFERALEAHRLLPGDPDNAFDAFQRLSQNLSEADRRPLRDRLRVALEDAGRQVLIRYLQGDQVPQTRADFERGQRLFDAALVLAPAAAANESRMLFCDGRVKIFDKQYGAAQKLLEQSIRLDPLHGYAYNALGIALLEQISKFPQYFLPAIQAFADARALEPTWAYPLHNLALAYAQRGDNGPAIDSYQSAMRIAPAYSYLPYNLGLLYERSDQPELAEKNFNLALKRAEARAARLGVPPDRWVEKAAPLNAIGTLYLSEGRFRAASRQFELALKADPKYVPALHNMGVVLAARDRRQEAVRKWREALEADPDFTAARVSLAQALLELRDFHNASLEFTEILKRHPDYLAARRSLAQSLLGLCRDGAALEELNRAVQADPEFRDLSGERDDVAAAIAGRAPKSRAVRRILEERTCP